MMIGSHGLILGLCMSQTKADPDSVTAMEFWHTGSTDWIISRFYPMLLEIGFGAPGSNNQRPFDETHPVLKSSLVGFG